MTAPVPGQAWPGLTEVRTDDPSRPEDCSWMTVAYSAYCGSQLTECANGGRRRILQVSGVTT